MALRGMVEYEPMTDMDESVADEVDYATVGRPESLKSLTDEEWGATPPSVRRAFMEREARSKNNHSEQLARLTGEMNGMRELLAKFNLAQPAPESAAKKPGIDGMTLEELESYHDRAEAVLAQARREPDNAAAQAEAAKLTPAVMRELMKAIARRSVGVSKDDIETLRAEIRGDKEAQAQGAALNKMILEEFGQASMLPGNAHRMAAEKAYTEIQERIKSGLTPAAALQYAAYKIAAGQQNGNRDGRANGADADGARRLAGQPDVAEVLRSLKTRSAALRAKGDELGSAMADVESEILSGMPEDLFRR